MAAIPRDERRTLVECAAEGLRLLDDYVGTKPDGGSGPATASTRPD